MNSKRVSGFTKLISNQSLLDYLSSVSIKRPTQVQEDCIPKLLNGGNYAVQGRTGSGKTLGYLLPIIEKLKERETEDEKKNIAQPKSIILLPTRELALQIFGIAKGISHFSKLRIRKLVGGDKGKSLDNLYRSQIDILITTPDRCLRVFKNKELRANVLQYLVFDEADQLLEPSFKKTVGELTSIINNKNVQIFLISASRPIGFSELIKGFFQGKKFKTVGKGEENILSHRVKTYNIPMENEEKFIYVETFVKKQNKRNGLIFMGNKARAKNVFELIKKTGHEKTFLLHKDLETKDRVAVVDKFRKVGGIMVATDIFARGIDITHLDWVLNFDLPSEPDYYLHRSGRVGRAGRLGDVFNFVTSKDGKRQEKINEALITQGRSDLKILPKRK
ncbi:MAG: DEAD/DEAH box helicase [Bacteriovoracaceae bacterium]|nr:DEAD/DEAH box helicase [Bacteriovoracaceae bacterium]